MYPDHIHFSFLPHDHIPSALWLPTPEKWRIKKKSQVQFVLPIHSLEMVKILVSSSLKKTESFPPTPLPEGCNRVFSVLFCFFFKNSLASILKVEPYYHSWQIAHLFQDLDGHAKNLFNNFAVTEVWIFPVSQRRLLHSNGAAHIENSSATLCVSLGEDFRIPSGITIVQSYCDL